MVSMTGLEGLQIFFVSYARINRDKVLEKFIHRLRDEVIQRASGKLRQEDVLFFDSEGIQTGEDWVRKLAAVVSSYKVCGSHLLACLCEQRVLW